MHHRVHTDFADQGLERWIAERPSGKLTVRIEIILNETGELADLGIVLGSGDATLLSADGRVYLHWEVSSDPTFACSTIGARPFLLWTDTPSASTP
jgi:hypothetical protein